MANETDTDGELDGVAQVYGKKVGDRLRAIRRQKGMSLQDAEEASAQEFKASVLGAYERGERAISVPRLQRLARFYNVPVDQLLPRDDAPGFRADDDGVVDLDAHRRPSRPARSPSTSLGSTSCTAPPPRCSPATSP